MLKKVILPRKSLGVAFARRNGTAVCLSSVDLAGMSIETTLVSELRVLASWYRASVGFVVLAFVFASKCDLVHYVLWDTELELTVKQNP